MIRLDVMGKEPSQFWEGDRRFWWWKVSETFHFSERPYGFGKVIEDKVELSDREVRQLLSSPVNFGLSEEDCKMLRNP